MSASRLYLIPFALSSMQKLTHVVVKNI